MKTTNQISKLSAFFKGDDIELGTFYPKGYLVAVFPNLTAAEHTVTLLRFAGFLEEDAISASSADVIRDQTEIAAKEGVWGFLMRALSRFFATEEVYTDQALQMAAKGAGFAVVHCPTESLKNDAWQVIEPLSPVAARYYAFGGIEHLAGD